MEDYGTGANRLIAATRAQGVNDERVLEAIRRVPREAFVPIHATDEASSDVPIPLPQQQTTTQPSLVARMVAALGLEGGEEVLEVGTGYGWQTALLATLARMVYSIEREPDLARVARQNLARRHIRNTSVIVGDGYRGVAEHAPYDAIIVSAAARTVPSPLADQLRDGGRLVMPMGPGGDDEVVAYERRDGQLVETADLGPARFVPLIGSD